MIEPIKLKTGDELVSAKSENAAIKHHAIALRFPNSPLIHVVDNNIGTGVRIHTLSQYLAENHIVGINPFQGPQSHQWNILNWAKNLEGTPYNLFWFNCEHLSSLLRFRKPESKQLQKYILIAIVLIIIIAAIYILNKRKVIIR